jgi:S-DNA-T family DNA segregation ATPase FtsK/SpoIIIE
VITGIIKANFPSRIAFQVASRADSRTILDANGAEKLLGKGDMLFSPANLSTPIRVQGSFISRAELERVIRYIESQKVKETETEYEGVGKGVEQKSLREDEPEDELFQDALQAILETGKASASFLQRRFRIGYNRAARLIDEMESRGIIGPQNSQKPREILINRGSLKK